MNRKKTITAKQIAAAILLTVFLFIHVVKILHRHEGSFTKTEISQKAKGLKSDDCPVCNYHFVKDGHHAVLEVTPQLMLVFIPLYADFVSQPPTSIGLASTDRGPPSLV